MDASQAQPVEVPLRRATCEVSATRPPMLFGLPRKLASLIGMLTTLCLIEMDTLFQYGGVLTVAVMVWFTVREQVARDLWGFDNWLAWFVTTFRFMDQGGKEGWGGARLCALPLNPSAPVGAARNAR